MVLNQPTFIKYKSADDGLHNIALQYLKELAYNYIQIHDSKNISLLLDNLRIFTNILKYEIHNKYVCGSK